MDGVRFQDMERAACMSATRPLRRALDPLYVPTLPAELADDRTAAVGEHHGTASFDHGRGLRGQDIDA